MRIGIIIQRRQFITETEVVHFLHKQINPWISELISLDHTGRLAFHHYIYESSQQWKVCCASFQHFCHKNENLYLTTV